MKLRFTRPSRLAAIGLGLGLILLPVAVHAATEPYFKVFGADVMSGGWFASGGACDTSPSGPYQDPGYSNNQSPLNGGIITYENYSKGGAGSQYGAFALGEVEGNQANNYGFYSSNSPNTNPSDNKKLTFANDSTYGGYYEVGSSGSGARQSNCIPDYFGTKQNNPTPYSGDIADWSALNGQYLFNNGSHLTVLNSVPTGLTAGRSVTLFINGNAYIGANITYQPGYTADNVPKLAVVVKGNLYIAPGVTQLDGMYIAQPRDTNPSADNGIIYTCHDQSATDPVTMPYIWQNCTNHLVINGALVAKQVNFLRIPGDVNAAGPGDTSLSGAEASGNVAEIINFTPEMVVGGPFFNPTGTRFQIQSLTSLPPLF